MAHDLPITLESAIRVLGRDNQRLLRKADRLLGVGLLAAGAIALSSGSSVSLLALLGPKNELIRLLQDLLKSVRLKAEKRQGISRTQVLLAAHTITVINAFFEAALDVLDELYPQLELSDEDKVKLDCVADLVGWGLNSDFQ